LLASSDDRHDHDEHACGASHDACEQKQLAGCCSRRAKNCSQDAASTPGRTSGRNSVVAMHAYRCQGNSPLWLTLAATAPLPQTLNWGADQVPGEWVVLRDCKTFSIPQAVDPPPPKS
jgi:hypothetical protein